MAETAKLARIANFLTEGADWPSAFDGVVLEVCPNGVKLWFYMNHSTETYEPKLMYGVECDFIENGDGPDLDATFSAVRDHARECYCTCIHGCMDTW